MITKDSVLIKENGLREEMEKYGLNDNDVTFIKEMIVGPTQDEETPPPPN